MSEALPFTLDPGDVVERAPWLVLEDGAVFGCHDAAAALAPLLTVAWLPEAVGATLEVVVTEELARMNDESMLVDYEPVVLGGIEAGRTLHVHRDPSGRLTASERIAVDWREAELAGVTDTTYEQEFPVDSDGYRDRGIDGSASGGQAMSE